MQEVPILGLCTPPMTLTFGLDLDMTFGPKVNRLKDIEMWRQNTICHCLALTNNSSHLVKVNPHTFDGRQESNGSGMSAIIDGRMTRCYQTQYLPWHTVNNLMLYPIFQISLQDGVEAWLNGLRDSISVTLHDMVHIMGSTIGDSKNTY